MFVKIKQSQYTDWESPSHRFHHPSDWEIQSNLHPQIHFNPLFDQAESDTHPAAWFYLIYHFYFISLFLLLFLLSLSHSFCIYFRLTTWFQSYRPPYHLFGRSIQTSGHQSDHPESVPTKFWYQSSSSWLRWYLSLHHISFSCICFHHKPKIHKKMFLCFKFCSCICFCVLSVHPFKKPRKRKEKVLFDSLKNRKSRFIFICIHKLKNQNKSFSVFSYHF